MKTNDIKKGTVLVVDEQVEDLQVLFSALQACAVAILVARQDASAPAPIIPENIIETLIQRDWPGNVRELSNVLQRYLQEHRLEFTDTRKLEPGARNGALGAEDELQGRSFREALEAYEKHLIARALAQQQNNMAKTAATLGMPLRTLYRKIEKYRLL
jgi:transcriptional regulator with PAS, ATPase and Fis domain